MTQKTAFLPREQVNLPKKHRGGGLREFLLHSTQISGLPATQKDQIREVVTKKEFTMYCICVPLLHTPLRAFQVARVKM